jgi:hypothetical protein
MKIKTMIAAACGATMLACTAANAATIEVEKGRINVVSIFNKIEPGDDAKLAKILAVDKSLTGDGTIVVMGSPGGALDAGIKMSMMIHARQLTTYIPDDMKCASVCAMMWLGGTKRLISNSGQVGFHAASVTTVNLRTGQETAGPRYSVDGTRKMLDYYSWLGFPQTTGQFLVSASYRSIHWMSGDELKQYGIEAFAYNMKDEPDGSGNQPGTSAPVLPPELQSPEEKEAASRPVPANPKVPVVAKADPLEDLPFIAAPKQDAPALAPSRIEQPRRVERHLAPRRVRVASRGGGRSCGIGIPLPYIGGITLRVRC